VSAHRRRQSAAAGPDRVARPRGAPPAAPPPPCAVPAALHTSTSPSALASRCAPQLRFLLGISGFRFGSLFIGPDLFAPFHHLTELDVSTSPQNAVNCS